MFEHHTAVDGHIIDPLLGLVLDHVEKMLRLHLLDVTAELFEHLIDRHGADRHGRGVDNRLTDRIDVFPSRKIHYRIGAEMHGCVQFFELLFDVARDGGVADVGVDFGFGGDADAHRLEPFLQVHCICGYDQPAAGDFAANQLGRKIFALGDIFHFRRDVSLVCRLELCHGSLHWTEIDSERDADHRRGARCLRMIAVVEFRVNRGLKINWPSYRGGWKCQFSGP
jgi:hypothetical protein